MNNTNLRYQLTKNKNSWGFRVQSVNGNIIATNRVSYARRANALKTLSLLKPANAPVEVLA